MAARLEVQGMIRAALSDAESCELEQARMKILEVDKPSLTY